MNIINDLSGRHLMAVEKTHELTGKPILVLVIDGVPHEVTIASRSTLMRIDGFDGEILEAGDPFDALSAFAAREGKKEVRVELPEEKRWKGLVKFSGDTSFSCSASKPNSSMGK